MKAIMANPIIMTAAVLASGYWTIGLLAPGPWLSAFVAAMLLVSGLIVLTSYMGDAWSVAKAGVIGDGQLALLGVTMLAAGSVYSGAFGLAWAFAGNPSGWLGTAFSTFGRAIMVPGFVLLFLSPDATPSGIRTPRWYLIAAGVIGMVVLAYVLGTRVKDTDTTLQVMAARAEERECPMSLPVKVTDEGGRKTYLIPHDRSYAMARAKACFADEHTAIVAGFRPRR